MHAGQPPSTMHASQAEVCNSDNTAEKYQQKVRMATMMMTKTTTMITRNNNIKQIILKMDSRISYVTGSQATLPFKHYQKEQATWRCHKHSPYVDTIPQYHNNDNVDAFQLMMSWIIMSRAIMSYGVKCTEVTV